MANYWYELDRIATALETPPETAFFNTLPGQLTAIFLAAILAYHFSIRMRKKHESWVIEQSKQAERRSRERQRLLLVSLLGDEIVLRWEPIIARDHREVLVPEKSLEEMKELSKITFDATDLFVFTACVKDPALLAVFEEKSIVSCLIHIHLLMKDFCEGCRDIQEEFERLDKVGPHRDPLRYERVWKALVDKFGELDKAILEVYLRIEKDYEAYVEESKFDKEAVIDISKVSEKLKAIYKKRLPAEEDQPK